MASTFFGRYGTDCGLRELGVYGTLFTPEDPRVPKCERPRGPPTTRPFPLGNGIVKKAAEYHTRADECRTLAARAANPEHKAMLHSMAETWENLARQRENFLARKARIASLEQPIPQGDRSTHHRYR